MTAPSWATLLACVAVVSVSFKPSGSSVRGHWTKRSKKSRSGGGGGVEGRPSPPLLLFLLLFVQCPRALAPLGLKETKTTATQATTLLSLRRGTHEGKCALKGERSTHGGWGGGRAISPGAKRRERRLGTIQGFPAYFSQHYQIVFLFYSFSFWS